jgi:D-alanyl-D-alanine dipeptidase
LVGSAPRLNGQVPAMPRQDFVNYAKDWCQFSLPGAGATTYDFPQFGRADE